MRDLTYKKLRNGPELPNVAKDHRFVNQLHPV